MKKDKFINFVLTGDKKYVMPLGVTMVSILKNLKDNSLKPRFFLFTTDFSCDDLDKLNEIKQIKPCEIINISMGKYLHYFDKIDVSKFKLTYVNLVCYYRLLMLKILPEDVDKCFYIDGDIIVQTDLSILLKKFPEDKLLAAVVESFAMQTRTTTLSHCYKMSAFKNFQEDPYKYPYFNAGFFLLNIKKSKELQLFKKAFKFLNKNPNPPYADQDTLNAIIGQCYRDKVQYLSPEYNVFCDPGINHIKKWDNAYYKENTIIKAIKKPKIFHYAGGYKPWLTNIANNSKVWVKYYKKSPWKNIKLPQNMTEKEEVVRYYLFNIIPLFCIRKNKTICTIQLFHFFPLCSYTNNGIKFVVKLFKVLPVIKMKRK